jgi:predicted TIM-barrel fold metal-dependent hydrolase
LNLLLEVFTMIGSCLASSPRAARWSLALVSGASLFAGLLMRSEFVAAQAPAAAENKPAPTYPGPLDGREGRELALDQFRPRSMLTVPSHQPPRAKFPVVDVHVHPRIRFHHDPERLAEFVRIMDNQNIGVCVSLDGGLGEQLSEHQAYLKPYADRFVIFANIDWRGTGRVDDPATWDCQRPDFGRRMAEALRAAKSAGAVGLKIFKDFGLTLKNEDRSTARIDDERWDPIWAACGELGFPILIHVADPAAFFLPTDERNERWEELRRHPDWSFYGPQFPRREDLFAQFLSVVKRHPRTTFIGAHVVDNAEDLASVSQWLDEHPNLWLEIASRISELGRQPTTSRAFLIKYQDRVMFGTDGPRVLERLLPHWRFLETRDEYFPYAENPFPPQGFWNIYGIGLDDDVLRKLYHENAMRLIPGVRDKLAKFTARAQ